jgi:hypothetical protein
MKTASTDITATVTKSVAVELIRLAGGTPHERGGWNLAGTHYWQTDEAFMVAIVEIAANDLAR